MRRRTRAAAAAVALTAAAAVLAPVPPAAAKETWQVVVDMPAALWPDGANMWLLARGTERLRVNGRSRPGLWQNFAASYPTTRTALRQAAERDQPQDVALSDRPLTPRESRRLRQRPLWIDADVLLVSATHPLCTAGLSLAQVRAILTGAATTWTDVVPEGAWPVGPSAQIRLYVPYSEDVPGGLPLFGVSRYAAGSTAAVEAQAVSGVRSLFSAVVAAKYSALRANPGACAVPVDGVPPTDDTVRAGTYPATQTVYWVTKRTLSRYQRVVLRAFERRVFGSAGADYLATYGDRDRLRP